ncbi:MAG: acyl-CoA thioesterase/bile acid-CoA:amino acid N-acyltransferase family protein [Planctomycetota bacterium]
MKLGKDAFTPVRVLAAAMLLIGLAGPPVRAGAGEPARLILAPARALVDEPIAIRVLGLEPGEPVTLRASMRDPRGRAWVSRAELVADERGEVDPARLAPLDGTYAGIDPHGLLWSMALADDTPEASRAPAMLVRRVAFEYTLEVAVEREGAEPLRGSAVRTFLGPGVVREDVRTDGLVGDYFAPPGPGPHPAVIVVAGSDGGLRSARWRGALLASRGIAALSLAYFRADGLPDELIEVPLDYTLDAVSWLAARDDVGEVGIVGFSKGTELALLAAAEDPRLRAVVAVAPTAYSWQGLGNGAPRASFTRDGEPVPFLRFAYTDDILAELERLPMRLSGMYRHSIDSADASTRELAALPIDRVRGAVLLISGDEDGSWPSSDMATELLERALAAGAGPDVRHLRYPEAGHLIWGDLLPTTASVTTEYQRFGGTPAANSRARADSWPRTLAFLHAQLARAAGE